MKKNYKYTKEEKKFIEDEFPSMCPGHQYVPAIIEAKKRICVFGDIHGDWALAIEMLKAAKLIKIKKDRIKWIGSDTYVVQVGDQIDRCRPVPGMRCDNPNTTPNDENSDIKIIELFNELNLQAIKVGGAVISLLGNHEIMNAMGQIEYASYQGIKQFESYVDPKNPGIKFKNGREARIHAFGPGNEYGKLLGCTRLPAVIIGTNIFVHAGIVDALINEISLNGLEDFEKINVKIRRWLLGFLDQNYVEHIIKFSKNSMFWTRILGKIPPGTSMNNPMCMDNIKNVLSMFNVGSMVIGHTPQSFLYSEDINSTCDNKIWRVDNGSSAAFNVFDAKMSKTGIKSTSRRTQYLEIRNDSEYYVCDATQCHKETKLTLS